MCKTKRKSPTKYSEEFKLSVLRDYYSSGMSKRKCAKKYGLCNPTLLSSWLSKYGEKTLSLPSEEEYDGMARRSKEEYRDENAALRKRVRELEKALAYSRLETEARDVMIDIAEREYEISIRKNMGPSSDGTGRRTRRGSLVRVPSVWPQPPGLLPVADLRREALFERAQHIGKGGRHTLGGPGHRLPQVVADTLLCLRPRTDARPRPLLPPAPPAWPRAGASEAPPHDRLQPPATTSGRTWFAASRPPPRTSCGWPT